jgi:hypothetical protein
MRELPEPPSEGSLVAVLVDELEDELCLYRLVMNDPPDETDFEPSVSPQQADARGLPELLRCGLSHYVELEQADAVRTKRGSMIARVCLRSGRSIAAARTGASPGHVTVWARREALVDAADIVVR